MCDQDLTYCDTVRTIESGQVEDYGFDSFSADKSRARFMCSCTGHNRECHGVNCLCFTFLSVPTPRVALISLNVTVDCSVCVTTIGFAFSYSLVCYVYSEFILF